MVGWKLQTRPSLPVGAAALAVLLAIESLALWVLLGRGYDLGSFLLSLLALLDLALIALLGGWLHDLARPARALGRNALVSRLFSLPYWQDRAVQATLLAALGLNVAVFGYVSFKFPSLPPILPLHYNIMGEIDFLGTRAEAFKIPGIGAAVLLGDFVLGLVLHSRERLAAVLLLSTAVLVQVILLVATLRIVY